MRGQITGCGLFVDVRGAAGDPPLLFLHGGPGEGAYEFMAVQGDHLGRMLRLVGLDQRGVGRSVPLPDGAPLTVADLVADCEEVRRALGIERWAVLGHSFGGALALRYATSHPGSITAVIFENPPWDMELSFRAALPRVAAMLADRGREREAQAAWAAAEGERSAPGLLSAYRVALNSLGEDREMFFIPSPQTRARLREIRSARTHLQQSGERFDDESSERHHQAITADKASYESLLPLLAHLPAHALLITGGQDPLTTAEQRRALRQASPHNQVREFPRAGHVVHADEPYPFASTVAEFVRANWPAASPLGRPLRSVGSMLDRLPLPPLPTLPGERVVLREPRESDVDDRLRHPIDPEEEDGYGSSWRREWDGRRYHTREHLARQQPPEPGTYTWMVEYDGRCIGSARLQVDVDQHCATYAVGLFVAALRGRGLGREVTRLVLAWAFNGLGVHRVQLEVLDSNTRAINCYLACGFRREGARREAELYPDGWKDFIMMGILRSEHAALA